MTNLRTILVLLALFFLNSIQAEENDNKESKDNVNPASDTGDENTQLPNGSGDKNLQSSSGKSFVGNVPFPAIGGGGGYYPPPGQFYPVNPSIGYHPYPVGGGYPSYNPYYHQPSYYSGNYLQSYDLTYGRNGQNGK